MDREQMDRDLADERREATTRDMFAMAALQGLLAAPWRESFRFAPAAHAEPHLVAANAYALADAMMKARNGQ